MPATLILSGKSEATYFRAILRQGHPWADLSTCALTLVDAKGDSQIPAEVERSQAQHHRTMVLYDKDALQRAGEQGSVIQNAAVKTHHLRSDFEGAFDPLIVQRALSLMGHSASLDRLGEARIAASPFARIRDCALGAAGAQPLDKAPLAAALAAVSEPWWYLPKEFFSVFTELGDLCDLQRAQEGWGDMAAPEAATGRLYLGNHVSNDHITWWDFDRHEFVSLPLPGKFDATIAVCRRGTRIVLRKYERDASGFPAKTWIHVFDHHGGGLEPATQFQVPGSAYELQAEEDGNHLQLFIQRDGTNLAIRCLANGTQRHDIPTPANVGLYAPRVSRSGKLTASLSKPGKCLSIHRQGTEAVCFPHLYAHSFTWSPSERHLAFFARRWRHPPDFLWLYDLATDRVYRLAGGEHFIPVHWAA